MLELDAAGDRPTARRLLQESVCRYREMGFPRMIGLVLASLGNIENTAANPDQAQTYFAESLRTLIDAGEPREIHFPLQELADLAYAAGQVKRAVTLTAAAATYRASLLGRPIGPLLSGSGAWLKHARASLTPQRFAAAWDAGEALRPHDALEEALASG
jgi:hypothetical protein